MKCLKLTLVNLKINRYRSESWVCVKATVVIFQTGKVIAEKKASPDLYNFIPVLRKYMYDRWAYDQGHVLSIPANWYYLSEDVSLVDIDETVVELVSGIESLLSLYPGKDTKSLNWVAVKSFNFVVTKFCGLTTMDMFMDTWKCGFQIIRNINEVNKYYIRILNLWIVLPTKLNVQRI